MEDQNSLEERGHEIVDLISKLSDSMGVENFFRRCWKCGGVNVARLTPIYHEVLPFVNGACWNCDDPNPNDPEVELTGKTLLGKLELSPEEARDALQVMLEKGANSTFVEREVSTRELGEARDEMVEDATEMIALVQARIDAGLPWVLIPGRNV